MPLYSYVHKKSARMKKIVKTVSFLCVGSGIVIFLWTIYPILSFELLYATKFQGLVEPVPNQIIKYALADTMPQIFGGQSTDFTKASTWFPKANNLRLSSSSTSYTLSIPKVRVENAQVIVGADDLFKSLTQFTGPLPGEYGNPVIFGHSTLLWFYNPKDYKAIFSKLPDLRKEDEIIVQVDQVTYKYRVKEMFIVHPDDLSVLDQDYQSQNITLVTCVPPGTTINRLVVRGQLDHNL